MQVVWGFLFGFFLWNEHFGIANLIGASIVVMCGFWIVSKKEEMINNMEEVEKERRNTLSSDE